MKSLAIACVLLACDKHDSRSTTLSTDPSASASVSARETTPAVSAPTAVSDAVLDAAPGAVVVVRPSTVLASASAIGSVSPAPTGARGAGQHVEGEHFAVDVAPPGPCARNVECKVPIRISAKDDFHVNQEYPYKIKLDESPGATFMGRDAAGTSTFSKSAGDFAFEGEKTGVMTIRFTGTQPGVVPLSGTLKLSVCNASNCKLESTQVRATVPIP